MPNAKPPVGAGFHVSFAERIRPEAGIVTAALGLIMARSHADGIVRNHRGLPVLLIRKILSHAASPLRTYR